MDALDILGVGAKVGRMVDFVFEKLQTRSAWIPNSGACEHRNTYNPSDFVANEVCRLVGIITLHQKIICKRPSLDRQH